MDKSLTGGVNRASQQFPLKLPIVSAFPGDAHIAARLSQPQCLVAHGPFMRKQVSGRCCNLFPGLGGSSLKVSLPRAGMDSEMHL